MGTHHHVSAVLISDPECPFPYFAVGRVLTASISECKMGFHQDPESKSSFGSFSLYSIA